MLNMKWLWVDITEPKRQEEPDWSKVPSERRAAVRAKWLQRHTNIVATERFKIPADQLDYFTKTMKYNVTVIREDL